MTKEKAIKEVEDSYTFIDGMIGDNGGIQPMIVIGVKRSDGKINRVCIVISSKEVMDRRRDFTGRIGQIFGSWAHQNLHKGVDFTVFLSEAFMSKQSKDVDPNTIKPSEQANRIECTVSCIQTNNGFTFFKAKEMKRSMDIDTMQMKIELQPLDEKTDETSSKSKSHLLGSFWKNYEKAIEDKFMFDESDLEEDLKDLKNVLLLK